ncbi:hypothetical protein [Phytohabitans houttuyneae]
MSNAAEPPDQIGVFLTTPRALTESAESRTRSRQPHLPNFAAGAVAEHNTKDPATTAREWIMQLCDRDLPMDAYELRAVGSRHDALSSVMPVSWSIFDADQSTLERHVGVHGDGDIGEPTVRRRPPRE